MYPQRLGEPYYKVGWVTNYSYQCPAFDWVAWPGRSGLAIAPGCSYAFAASLQPSTLFENVELEVRLTSNDEVDSEVLGRLQKAYEQNRE